MPLVASRWGVVVVATPHPAGAGREENSPYVVGNIKKAMSTLTSLVHGARNPFRTVVPIRLVMVPGATEAPSKSPRF